MLVAIAPRRGLWRTPPSEAPAPTVIDVVSKALEILQWLGYSRSEAQRMIGAASERLPKPSNAEESIRTVYQVQREKRE
jgi:Holliday junction resolvasome RuvABC DNA-binding subunit